MAYVSLWILCPHNLKIKNKKEEIYFALAGLSGVTLYQFLENTAILYTSATNVSIIVSICPLFAAITAQIFLHEKQITPFFIAGFVIAILGIALVSFNGTIKFHFSPKGDVMALCAAVSWGFYTLLVSRINSFGYSNLASTRRIFFWSLVFMIPLILAGAFFSGFKNSSEMKVVFDASVNASRFADPLNWVNLCFLGIAASALCFAAWNIACETLGSIKATLGIYLIPVVTTVFAYFALGEKITIMGLVGTAFAVVGLVISGFKKK